MHKQHKQQQKQQKQQPFHLTGISVCVNYDDFLAITLPQNITHFNKYIIITSEKDGRTCKMIEMYNDKKITLIKTNIFYENGAQFNKGAAIRQVQKSLLINSNISWICILDADIVLPNNFREVCMKVCTNKNLLYGAQRINYETYDDYINEKPSQICNKNEVGIGFLQIYFKHKGKPKFYSTRFKTAAVCDMEFKSKWARAIKDIGVSVKHLGESCANWKGRTTNLFIAPL
jgi:hypothetical protein